MCLESDTYTKAKDCDMRNSLRGETLFHQICFLFLISLLAFSSVDAQKLHSTSRLAVTGSPIALYVTPGTAIRSIDYYRDTVLIGRANDTTIYAYSPDVSGYQTYRARVTFTNNSFNWTDSIGIYVATQSELARLVLEEVKYSYKSQTFPDSLILLPQGAVVLGYTHYSTLKTLIKYLNPRF